MIAVPDRGCPPPDRGRFCLARVADDLAAVDAAAVEAYRPGADNTLEVAHTKPHGVPALRLVDILDLPVTR
ncbi:hypothetical protein ONA91_26035 [Micromonospora sp. DR5-3]|uniref:hypothetical protein n=1 Tax=unclassified Micromonospora TaxID=2617518 RepID=UPI0011D67C2E|nr:MULTISPECIES: hypothetical protein [unclassified Micromonospora]MCW3817914.1 hypothetical protein [Micromonospora sp. DR5-3]TYC22930.1 hypothetical protein FXF52_17870 [Micromonospora sp. MP36]